MPNKLRGAHINAQSILSLDAHALGLVIVLAYYAVYAL